MVPGKTFPAHSFVIFGTATIANYLDLQVTVEFCLYFAVILYGGVIEHRSVQINTPAGPDNAYLFFNHQFVGNASLLTGP